MKQIAYIALLLGSGPALAQADPAATPTQAAPAAQTKIADRVICQRVEEIGSRLGGKRVCMTQQQWDEQRRHTREDFEEAQHHKR
jgi:hypothetical protein